MIDLGIVNDFADNKEPAIFEDFARGISEIDRALNAITEAELFCQAYGRVVNGNRSTGTPHFFDNVAPVM